MEENTNLSIYNKVKSVPQEAQKPINAGRLKGKTDINPMWRIKCLTEQFGVCGFGWKYEIKRMWLEHSNSSEISAFVEIALYIKIDGQWSEPIPGIGGSSFVAMEKAGPYQSDECYKMALTDAISVACKALGMAAEIYWNSDRTKYENTAEQPQQQEKKPAQTKNLKIISRQDMTSEKFMAWIYSNAQESKKANKRFSLINLVSSCYQITQDDHKVISDAYNQYIINHNLPS